MQPAGVFGKAAALGHKLLSLDATVIDLCAAVFDWAKFRTTKGAVKLHLLLDHEGHLPAYAVITPGERYEIRVARRQMPKRHPTIDISREIVGVEKSHTGSHGAGILRASRTLTDSVNRKELHAEHEM